MPSEIPNLAAQVAEQAAIVLQQMFAVYTDSQTSPQAVPVMVRSGWAREPQPTYPLINVIAIEGEYSPAAMGQQMSGTVMGSAVSGVSASRYHLGGIHDWQVHVFVLTQTELDREEVSDFLKQQLWYAFNTGNQPWLHAFQQQGLQVYGKEPDQYSQEDPSVQSTEAQPLFQNLIVFNVRTPVTTRQIPSPGFPDGVRIVATIVTPTGPLYAV